MPIQNDLTPSCMSSTFRWMNWDSFGSSILTNDPPKNSDSTYDMIKTKDVIHKKIRMDAINHHNAQLLYPFSVAFNT